MTTIEIKVPDAYPLVISKEELIREVESLAQIFLLDRQMQTVNRTGWRTPADDRGRNPL